MIGVICRNDEKEIVREFFELFKTPWAFYKPEIHYEVIICTDTKRFAPNSLKADFVMIFSSKPERTDSSDEINLVIRNKHKCVSSWGDEFPLYGDIVTFRDKIDTGTTLRLSKTFEPLDKRIRHGLLKIGYDLFSEVAFLLTVGQPEENSRIPTLDIHIALIRRLIIQNGITLIEIPPVPYGHPFVCCITHDVDFISIKKHVFDHAFYGFIYRASFGSILRFFRKKIPLRDIIKNFGALFSLPLIFMGLVKDFWNQVDGYIQIENGLKSTFFLIPFKNKIGQNVDHRNNKKRKVKYDITDIQQSVDKIIASGKEVGVHGIDSWIDVEKGMSELNRVKDSTRQKKLGIRMHWLLFNNESWKKLEDEGYHYDSSFGYNTTVGYRAGTGQVYKPIGREYIYELPLHIQDTTLLLGSRMNLSKINAVNVCVKFMDEAEIHGGVITILWHMRSLAPERLWDDVYASLLKIFDQRKAWITSASEVIGWFDARRSVRFTDKRVNENTLKITFDHEVQPIPPLQIRIYHKINIDRNDSLSNPFFTVEHKGQKELTISLDEAR
jgi:hypothetical protein